MGDQSVHHVAEPTRQWVLHDYLQVHGGAERLVMTLARSLPGWGLAVSGIYPDFARSVDLSSLGCEVIGSRFQRLPRVARALLAFGTGPDCLADARQVIYSGLYAPLAVRHQRGGQRIFYCHTPPRFAFDWMDRYLRRCPAPMRPALKLSIAVYRKAYLQALGRMDKIVSNSAHVRQRLQAWTGFDSTVIYPPIATDQFVPMGQGDYYLSLARLEPLKRVDRIVQAFLAMPDKKLVVASGGSQLPRLKALAAGASNITLTDWVDDQTLSQLIGHAVATLYIPEDEDFGMSAVESMAAGKPVIAAAEGGIRETVLDGHTGLLLASNPSAQAVAQAVRQLSPERAAAMETACRRRAADFSNRQFLDAFNSLL